MAKYSMNEAEMRKALALLEHVEGEIREACNFINSAYRKISSQSGLGIREARRLMVNNGSVIDRQVENILVIKEYIQLVLEQTAIADIGAKQTTIGGVKEHTGNHPQPNYGTIINEYINNKVENFMGRFDGYKDIPEAIVGWYDWFKGEVIGDFEDYKGLIEDIIEEYTFKKPELLPESCANALEKLSEGQFFIDLTKEVCDFIDAGDGAKAYKEIGFTLFGKGFKEFNKWWDKKNNLKYLGADKMIQKIFVDTIIEMPQQYIKEIENYVENGEGTAGTIVVNSTAGVFVETTAKAAKPAYKLTTALTYPVIDQICECIGYDLSGDYERLTGKTGLNAVFSAQKELWIDTVYPEAKGWMAEKVDATYQTFSAGWNNWKSGIKIMFGGK